MQTLNEDLNCGADRDVEIHPDHDYLTPVCLPGHVLVKLWSSECYTCNVSTRDAHTVDTLSTLTHSDPSIRTLLSFVVGCTSHANF